MNSTWSCPREGGDIGGGTQTKSGTSQEVKNSKVREKAGKERERERPEERRR